MSENQSETTPQGYDAAQDPDSDPEMLSSRDIADQPDQAEGEEADTLEDPSS